MAKTNVGSNEENNSFTTPASRALANCKGASHLRCPNCPANRTGSGGGIDDLINSDHPPCCDVFGDPDYD